jgi:hypothetical protein
MEKDFHEAIASGEGRGRGRVAGGATKDAENNALPPPKCIDGKHCAREAHT